MLTNNSTHGVEPVTRSVQSKHHTAELQRQLTWG